MKKFSLLLTLSCCVLATPAFAGFQWTPPATQQAPVAAPIADVSASDLLTPLPNVAPAPASVPAPVFSKEEAVVPAAPRNLSAFEAPALTAQPATKTIPVVAEAPVMSAYEQEIPQKHPVRPIRIDTRTHISSANAPMVIIPAAPQPVLMRAPAAKTSAQPLPIQTTERRRGEGAFTAPEVSAPSMTWVEPVRQQPLDMDAEQAERTAALPEDALVPAASPAPASDGFTSIDGFGRDIPLPLAVRQIVPEGYGLAFDRLVDTSSKITWEGGHSWLQVLNAALSPKGLRADVSGKLVRIHPNTQVIGESTVTTAVDVSIVESGVSFKQETPQGVPTIAGSTAQAESTAVAAVQPQQMAVPQPAPQQDMSAIMPAAGGAEPLVAPTQGTLAAQQSWVAAKGATLRETLQSWSEQAGVQLYWASGYDYPLATDVALQGSFDQAVQTLLKGFASSHPKPTGRLHPNLPNGPAVLVIETQDQPK